MIRPEYLKTWIIFLVVTYAITAFAVLIVGLLLGMFLSAWPEGNLDRYDWLINVISIAISLPISFLAFKWTVRRFLLEPICDQAKIELEGVNTSESDFL